MTIYSHMANTELLFSHLTLGVSHAWLIWFYAEANLGLILGQKYEKIHIQILAFVIF